MSKFSENNKAVIRAYAGGDKSLRDEALAIFHAELRSNGVDRACPYFEFMSEIDAPVPDLMYRSMMRAKITGMPFP